MIIVLAKAIPKDEAAKEKIIDIAQDTIKSSKSESGNVTYDLFENTSDGSLMFVEQWESREVLALHVSTEHFIDFDDKISDLSSDEFEVKIFEAEEITDL